MMHPLTFAAAILACVLGLLTVFTGVMVLAVSALALTAAGWIWQEWCWRKEDR